MGLGLGLGLGLECTRHRATRLVDGGHVQRYYYYYYY